jgi:hypothetical protein
MNPEKRPKPERNYRSFSTTIINLFVYLFISIFFFLAVYDFYQGFIIIINPPSLESKRFVAFWITSIIPISIWGYGLYLAVNDKLQELLNNFYEFIPSRLPISFRIILASLAVVFPTILFLFSPFGKYSFIYWLRLFTILSCSLFAVLFLFSKSTRIHWPLISAGMILVVSDIFVLGDWMTGVSSYPFSLSWSEGNRFWDYSIMFGMQRYIYPSEKIITPFLEIGRQFLWALPFAVPSIGIWGMRLWNVFLWVVPPMLLGWAAVFNSRTFRKEWVWQLGFGLWSFLFLSQGPIYPPLVISAIMVVVAVRQRKILVAILLIAIASYFARISRWTWLYSPGLWAGMLALIEINQPSFRSGRWKELIRPVVFGLAGLAGAEIIPKGIRWFNSGMSADDFPSIVTANSINLHQPMLWDRLFPNPTYAPGILLGFFWVGGPVILLLFWLVIKNLWKPNWMQRLSILSIAGTFSVLGVIISVKIGGGSNLHNLDMLWLTLTLLVAWVFRNWLNQGLPGISKNKSVLVLLCLVIIFPITTMIQYGEPYDNKNDGLAAFTLKKINSEIDTAKIAGEILFIDQRQLLTFGYVKDVPLVAEYEKKLLMDQSLSNNEVYFENFYDDLQNHRFSLIVSEPIGELIADEATHNFAEENNAWVNMVSTPMLKFYKPKITFSEIGIQLLVPRNE